MASSEQSVTKTRVPKVAKVCISYDFNEKLKQLVWIVTGKHAHEYLGFDKLLQRNLPISEPFLFSFIVHSCTEKSKYFLLFWQSLNTAVFDFEYKLRDPRLCIKKIKLFNNSFRWPGRSEISIMIKLTLSERGKLRVNASFLALFAWSGSLLSFLSTINFIVNCLGEFTCLRYLESIHEVPRLLQ